MFDNIIVGVDGREGGQDAIALADQLAAPTASVTPTTVYDAEHRPAHGSSVAQELHEAAERGECDLLVVGSCRRGVMGRMVHGDETTDLLTGAPCAVAIAPPGYAVDHRPLSRIGVGFDGSPEAKQALVAARRLADRRGSSIKALLVLPVQSRPYGEPVGHRWPDIAGLLAEDDDHRFDELWDVDAKVGYGRPGEELEHFSEELDLLIVGSRRRSHLRRTVAGSTSNHLARRTRCPLLALPGPTNEGSDPLTRQEESCSTMS